jgi:hypothetical protein
MTDWTIGGVRFYCTDLQDNKSQIIARLNPLAGGTTLHFFGWDDRITKISGYVVGISNKETIEDFNEDGNTARTLMTPYGTWGDFFISKTTFTLTNVICQTLDPTQDADEPVFKAEVEIFRSE